MSGCFAVLKLLTKAGEIGSFKSCSWVGALFLLTMDTGSGLETSKILPPFFDYVFMKEAWFIV